MSPSLARPVSTGYFNFSVLGVHSTRNRRPRHTRTFVCRALTIATLSWRVRRKRRPTYCNECWTPQPVWSSSTDACRDSRLLHTELHWQVVPEQVVYTLRHGVQLPARSSASIPREIVTSRRCRIAATSPILHPTAPSRRPTVLPAQHLQPTGFLWLVRRSGIPCRTACGMPAIGGNSFRQSLKTFLFMMYTDSSSVLEVLRRCAI